MSNSKSKIKRIVSFMIASQRIEYLVINPTKEQNLFS